ncbi:MULTISPECIES: TRAP transporter substrate-binding protein [unclassified Uliginosibacterium]|uniref:TRAP transporter substrate-binding protein n=1 Tax=unclassified Uliginosibacterium TaxID=2621521 RepID=UPI000C7A2010|nr:MULTISPECIES: TRAP transporter substrate-binding protein [unclassified Uliginosibacterium]MDO6386234.1 TRAP transporter substrate-binding protein [Uliginosibacterium sp. 31-12]PLK49300.1 C4-dicarboxylate ABC transporter substrate-binding protein [Uliginosibacterium sp. TH139]
MKRLAFLLMLAFSAPAALAQVELKLGHFGAEDHPAQTAAKQFAKNVEARTGGKVKIKLFPNNQLGNPPEVLEQAVLGAIDMSLSGQDQIAKYVPKFDAVSTPFAFKDYAMADKVIDGDFKKWVAKDLEAKGLVYLSAWEWGFREVTNSKRPILKPEDMKGLKIRTPPAFAYQAFVEACGGLVQTIGFSELVMAMKTGVVDGQENPIAVIYSLKLYESQKYISMLNYTYSSMTHVVSKRVWDKLTPEQQKVIQEESDSASKLMRHMVRDQEATQIAEMKKMGIRIDTPDLAPFKAAMPPAYEKVKAKVGAKNFDEFMAILKKNGG